MWPSSQRRAEVDVRKVPADSVPYGESISLNGKTCWAAYDPDGVLICVAPTSHEARKQYCKLEDAAQTAKALARRDLASSQNVADDS
jgi:hypothetical protein